MAPIETIKCQIENTRIARFRSWSNSQHPSGEKYSRFWFEDAVTRVCMTSRTK